MIYIYFEANRPTYVGRGFKKSIIKNVKKMHYRPMHIGRE